MAYGMIGLSLLLYGGIVVLSYVGKDHRGSVGSGSGSGSFADDLDDLGADAAGSAWGATLDGARAGLDEEDGVDHRGPGVISGIGGGVDKDETDHGHDSDDSHVESHVAGDPVAEAAGITSETGAGNGRGGLGGHRKRASEDAFRDAEAQVRRARAVNRLVGMDKVDQYLAKRHAHKAAAAAGGHGHVAPRGGGGGDGGHRARDGWVASSRSASDRDHTDTKFYDQYLKKMLEKKPPYPLLKGFLHRVIDLYPDSRLWFDGGAGTCGTMEALAAAGKDVKGVEISDVRKTSCAGMARQGRVVQGTLDRIPYPDDAFDVVFSSEVLEHVPPNLAAASVRELVRISRGDIFVTISLRRSGLDPKRGPTKVHLTVRPREWWEKLFIEAGCEVNKANLAAFEQYDETKFGTRPNFFSFKCEKRSHGARDDEHDGEGGGGVDHEDHGHI